MGKFAELDLGQHVTKLKPLVFEAEKEGLISDQVRNLDCI